MGDESSLKRKVREAMLAQRVEKRYTKNQILELYLNTIYFGHGAYGVESASQVVLRQDRSNKLTLAGVGDDRGRHQVARALLPLSRQGGRQAATGHRARTDASTQGYITPAQFAAASASGVKTVGLKSPPARAPYFVEWVKTELANRFGQDRAVPRRARREDDARPRRAEGCREGDRLDAQPQGRSLGRSRRDQAGHGRGGRDGRWPGLRDPAVQRRRPGQRSSAGFLVQALRARDRAQRRNQPRADVQVGARQARRGQPGLERHRRSRRPGRRRCVCVRQPSSPSTRSSPASSSRSRPRRSSRPPRRWACTRASRPCRRSRSADSRVA